MEETFPVASVLGLYNEIGDEKGSQYVRGLNLAAVKHRTVQVSRLPL
jgi:hypothetical protein